MESNCGGYTGFWVRDPAFYKTLIVLALPIMLQNALTYGVALADNLMVGRLGENAISGLSMAILPFTVLQIMLFGVESTVLILSAQYWGRHDRERIKDVVSIAMRLSLVGSVAAALAAAAFPELILSALTTDHDVAAEGSAYLRAVALSYPLFCISQILVMSMRSVEIVKVGLANSLTAFCVNIFLNWVLIFGKLGAPELGVVGAAYATCISRLAELGVVLFFVLRMDTSLKLRPRDFLRWNRSIFDDLVRYGTPLMLGQIVWSINNIGQNSIIGRLPASAIAAASISGMFDRLLWMSTWGVAAATGIMVGKAIGAGEFDKVRQYAKTMQAVFLAIGLVSGLIVLSGRGAFLSFYPNLTAETREVTNQFMLVLAVVVIGRCYQAPSLFGLVKAGGDTAFVFKNDTFWVFCWVLPASLLALKLGAPAWSIFLLLLSDQIAKCFVALWKINSFNWMRNLTRD